MRRLELALAVTALFAVGCTKDQPVQPPTNAGPAFLISDGTHAGGNANFFFLPPLVPDPSGSLNFNAATFNPKLSPVVDVCRLQDNPLSVPSTDCLLDAQGNPVLVFGPAPMPLDGQQYHLNWDTGSPTLLDPNGFYRIKVRGARQGTVLGFLDLDPVTGGVKNLRSGEVVQFQDGRTLPIKVRIQEGAFGSTNPDHVEQTVGNVATIVTTNTGFAGASFPDGWIPQNAVNAGITQVVVIVERKPVHDATPSTSCLQSGLVELEGCYRFRTDPDLHQFGPFSVHVIEGVCFQMPINTQAPFQLFRRAEDTEGNPKRQTVALEDAYAPFLQCATFAVTRPALTLRALRSGHFQQFASAGWHAILRGIGRLLTPEALHAVDLGAGGSTDGFSVSGYARGATMTKTAATDNQSATAGMAVLRAPEVCLTLLHPTPGAPLVGDPVTFTVKAGGGTVDEAPSATVLTGTDGCAHVPWVLGSTPGANSLEATALAFGSPQPFTATGTAPPVEIAANNFVIDLRDGMIANASVFKGGGFYKGTQVVFASGLVYGTSVNDVLVGYNTRNGTSDFDLTSAPTLAGTNPLHTSAQLNPRAPGTGISGVSVAQESFAYSSAPDADYVLLKYTFTNTGGAAVTNVFAGYVADLDLLYSGTPDDDLASFAAALGVTEATESHSASFPQVIGIVPISSAGAGLNYQGYVRPDLATGTQPRDPVTSAGYFNRMSHGILNPDLLGPSDIRQLVGLGPFSIPAGGSQVVWFALVGGDNSAAFAANVTAARTKVAALSSSLPRLACSLEPTLHSITGDVSTSIQFMNQTSGPVTVYWLNYQGERVIYNTLLAGQSYDQQTFLTHPWVVTDANGVCLGIWLPSASPGVAVIGG